MSRLHDKVALVTGAARGIGAAIVKAFTTEGARVWLTDVSVDSGRRLVTVLTGAALTSGAFDSQAILPASAR
jgi:NAD(P)-dependent dehydrogenase (short-subunit alcohol dehydrogenase family)